MNVRPISSLTDADVADLARTAADNGEDPAESSPFAGDDRRHAVFVHAHAMRMEELGEVMA